MGLWFRLDFRIFRRWLIIGKTSETADVTHFT
jgi:hypothetical protein